MEDSEKIQAIKQVFEAFNNEDNNLDAIDVCIKIEGILKK